ncbi:MAG: alanine--tRNA ligase [Rikenellaceae bacterium]|nr:alanine--tRNA ligase [Rikenellaceae bacterium]
MTSKEIRDKFLTFFASKHHAIVPSAPMVVKNDPTLMFTNAGMNQFKDWFLGNSPAKHTRVTDSQKCLRVSGKHNDLEEVGHDSYHHTMFEMLGNWSFGDYFKKEAVEWAWELLNEVYGIDKERLYVTVFEGSSEDKISADDEARNYWLQYLPAERIINGNKKDNFWEMGDTGPCGPCSEIHVDIRNDEDRKKIDGASLVNKGNPLVIEIWNLVFIQYNRKANGELVQLPQKHVDTGMGLERLCMVLQGKQSNYDTDLFTNMISSISRLCGKKYLESPQISVAMRVIADHIRAISFSIADGQLPSNVKAGYVIRRILRRAVRYAYTFLDMDQPFLCRLVPTLVDDLGSAYPELVRQQPLIEKVIREEEEAFLRTLDKGIRLMDTLMEKNKLNKLISGEEAFTLYDTYGFPIDLSELIAKEHGYKIDLSAFENELAKQKERSRNATSTEEGDWIDVHPYNGVIFVGYDKSEEQVKIVRYRKVKAKSKEYYQLVFDKSPFYAESGGQIGDTGYIESPDGTRTNITNTIKENNLIIHISDSLPDSIESTFTARIDLKKRETTANNHTATHLLHKALRELLGTHIEQKGSLVNYNYFRFDFSHYEKIGDDMIRRVENRVNELVRENAQKDEMREIPVDEARKMGAMALFGEKYGNKVRVIRFNDSIELCGGTHTSATGNIGYFKILSESAIAAGVRRIEATTGEYAEKVMEQQEDMIRTIKGLLNNNPNPVSSIQKLVEENEALRKSLEEEMREKAKRVKDTLVNNSTVINGMNIVTMSGIHPADFVKNIAFMIHKEMTKTVFVAGCEFEGKANLSLMYTDDLTAMGYNASKDIREAAPLINGGGGGQNFFASAGGKKPEGLEAAISKLTELATQRK